MGFLVAIGSPRLNTKCCMPPVSLIPLSNMASSNMAATGGSAVVDVPIPMALSNCLSWQCDHETKIGSGTGVGAPGIGVPHVMFVKHCAVMCVVCWGGI